MATRGAASARLAAMASSLGMGLIGLALGLSALCASMAPSAPSVVSVLPIVWSRFLGGGMVPTFLSEYAPRDGAPCAATSDGTSALASACVMSLNSVLKLARRTAGSSLDVDSPLMEAGVDSLGALELRNSLQSAVGVSLPSTIVFDHPTARLLFSLLDLTRPVRTELTLADAAQPCSGYETLHGAGERRHALMGCGMGVYVGVWACEFAEALTLSPLGGSVYAATAVACSVVVGRVSYVLGLHGPCVSFDTACSSGLAAGHAGARGLHHGECAIALVAGVNMLFSPRTSFIIAAAGMTSPTGRCHTFDARADGYARGEACGAVALSEGGDSVGLLGSAVRQDGRSASLTAPSGQAQQGLLRAALADAVLAADALALSEVHGTGTALGDPIEAGSLAGAMLSARSGASCPVGVGGVKANIGHAEPAAGMTGLLALASALERGASSPNAQLRVLNAHVCGAVDGGRCVLPTQLGATTGSDVLGVRLIGGVSSFGYSGTIAHAVLRYRSLFGCTGIHAVRRAASVDGSFIFIRIGFKRCIFSWRVTCEGLVDLSANMFCTCWSNVIPADAWTCSGLFILKTSMDPGQLKQADMPSAGRACSRQQLIAVLLHASVNNSQTMNGANIVPELLRLVGVNLSMRRNIVLVTHCAQATTREIPVDTGSAAFGSVWGFARVMRLEYSSQSVLSVDAATKASVFKQIQISCKEEEEMAHVTHDRQPVAARIRRDKWELDCGRRALQSGSHAITGGLGGLGIRAAKELRQQSETSILLASRSGNIPRDDKGVDVLQTGVTHGVYVITCDTAVALDVHALLCVGAHLSCVLHAAGAFDKSLLANLLLRRMSETFAPKVAGTWHLHSVSTVIALEAMILFSSVGSALANIGQFAYAGANASIDALARSRRWHGAATCSLQWPLISEAGRGAIAFAGLECNAKSCARMAGMASISLTQYATILRNQLVQRHGVASGVKMVHRTNVSELLLDAADSTQTRFRELRAQATAKERHDRNGDQGIRQAVGVLSLTQCQTAMQELVLRTMRGMIDLNSTGIDVPLLDAGLDSLAAIELSSQLRTSTGIELPALLVFEQSTVRAISSHMAEMVAGSASPSAPQPASSVVTGRADDVPSILSTASRWPASVSSLSDLGTLLNASGDAIGQTSSRLGATEASAFVQYAGFVADVEKFDSCCFRVSPLEVESLDPQQRLLLEVGFQALHAAPRCDACNRDVGTFVGIELFDWQALRTAERSRLGETKLSLFALTGESGHAASARLSFVFDLNGPCLSINTACSSALVAVHYATASVRGTDCRRAIAAGVKMILLAFPCSGIWSSDGRSKSFDVRADGYGRSEAVGAAVCDINGSKIVSILGSAVYGGGTGASLTAPGGSAQSELIRLAVSRTSLTARDLEGAQAQGLGSQLVDPIEMSALTKALGGPRSSCLAVSCHKANAGHSEAPSGLFGMLTALHVFSLGSSAGNAQVRIFNPLVLMSIQSSRPTHAFPTTNLRTSAMLTSGVIAFGISGVAAYVVLHRAKKAGHDSLPRPFVLLTYRRQTFPWLPCDDYCDYEKIEHVHVDSVASVVQQAIYAALGKRRASLGDRLVELGADSVSILQLRLELIKHFPQKAPSASFLAQSPSVEEVTEHIYSKGLAVADVDSFCDDDRQMNLDVLPQLRFLGAVFTINFHLAMYCRQDLLSRVVVLDVMPINLFCVATGMSTAMLHRRACPSGLTIAKRVANKVYPLFWVCWLIALPLVMFPCAWTGYRIVLLGGSFLLVKYSVLYPFLLLRRSTPFVLSDPANFMDPSWYLSAQLLFVFAFPLIRRLFLSMVEPSHKPLAGRAILQHAAVPFRWMASRLTMVGLLCFAVDLARLSNLPHAWDWFYMWSPAHLPHFTLGAILGHFGVDVFVGKHFERTLGVVVDISFALWCVQRLAGLSLTVSATLEALNPLLVALGIFALCRSRWSAVRWMLSHIPAAHTDKYVLGVYLLHVPVIYWTRFIHKYHVGTKSASGVIALWQADGCTNKNWFRQCDLNSFEFVGVFIITFLGSIFLTELEHKLRDVVCRGNAAMV